MSKPRPEEFRHFHDLLVENAPEGYTPWYFRVRAGSKAPATKYGSWKDADSRLDVDEAVAWMEDGGNVGLAGTGDCKGCEGRQSAYCPVCEGEQIRDRLVNVDIDDEDETTPEDLKQTLIARSRSRTGVHGWYFAAPGEEIPNIPTNDAGEVRTNWQYVVAPGSYVDTDPEKVPEEHRDEAGYYTVEREAPVTSLRFNELPKVFREHHEETEQQDTDAELQYDLPEDGEDDSRDDRGSALFDIDAEDVIRKEGGSTDTADRWSSVFHGSDTDANMSVSSRGLIQCWRHGVTHNGFQALVTLSDYKDGCEQVGAAHKGSNAGSSSITNEDGAHVWHAWKYAKQNGYLPDDDPVPYSAIKHVCRERDLCAVTELPDSPDDGSIPAHAYDMALRTIEEHDELDPGRVPTDEIDDDGVPDRPNVERVEEDEDDERVTHGSNGGGSGDEENAIASTTALDVYRGGYGYFESNDNGDSWFERVTNFELDVESFLFKDGDRIIDMTVVPSSGEETYDLTVPAKVFNDARRFRDNVVVGLSTTFEGSPSDLNELRKLVASQDAPQRQGTHHMGLHPDAGEFVTPDGVLTADGWTDDPEMAYIQRDIGAERSNLLDPDEIGDYDAEEVASILELLPQTRNADRFLPVLGWLYTAPLRPYVDEWAGQFNTLHVTGETGAGKSSTLSLAWQLLGMDGDPMACDDTKFALTTNMASSNSIPMWFDEYKPGDMKDWELDRFQNLMRKSTRGGVETRGNADKSTEEYRLQAPLMISGEQAVQGAAEERRSIQTRFRDNVKQPGSTTKKAFAELTGMAYDDGDETKEPQGYDLQQHALAYYRFVLQTDEVLLNGLWRQSRDHVRDLLTEYDITGVDDLPRQGIQTVHFGMSLYRRFADHVATEAGVETPSLPSDEEVEAALLYVARQFGDNGDRKSHLDRFVEVASRAAGAGYLEEGEHYTAVREGEPDEQLAIHLPRTHDTVSKYVRDHGLDGEDLLNTAADYRDRMKEAADDGSSYVDTHSKYSPPLSRCARIDTAAAEEQLEFDPSAFGLEAKKFEADTETGGSEDDEDDDPDSDINAPSGAVPVRQAANDATGYPTVTVEVITTTQLDGDKTPALKAMVKDRSSAINVKSWNDPHALEEGGTYLIKNAEFGEYDGSAELTILEKGTEVVEIEPGVGYTEGAAPDEDQSQIGSKASATDGGEPAECADSDDDRVMNQDIRDRIVQETTKRIGGNGASREDLLDAVSSALGVSEDRVAREIGEVCREGRIYEPMEDRFKV